MKRIYFDYAATTPIDPKVKVAMAPYFSCPPSANWRSGFGNPGSLHSFGQEAMAAVDFSRETIAKSIGADFREIIFTGSATEANNLALRGVVKGIMNNELRIKESKNNRSNGSIIHNSKFFIPRIIISAIEHESILETAKDLENEGAEVIYLPVNKNGQVDLKKLKENLNERTILVSVMYANNEIGTIEPISEIAKTIRDFHESNVNGQMSNVNEKAYPLFHCDAVQAFQYLDCDVQKLGVDFMTLSAHKIYGPKGIGALYARRNNESRIMNNATQKKSKFIIHNSPFIIPIITGGGQEFGFRSGTENVPAIIGFAKAIELVSNSRELENRRIGELQKYFWRELKKIYPKISLNNELRIKNNESQKKSKFIIHNSPFSIPNILNIYFPNNFSEDLLIKLDMAGIAVSAGSACTARATKSSHVLVALGLPKEQIRGSIRFSFGRFTTKSELVETLKRLKKLNFA